MAEINYKTIGGVFFIILAFAITIFGATADTTPFQQCIKVIDFNNGSSVSTLTCNLYNTTNFVPMIYNSTLNTYCFNVNDSYHEGSYDFFTSCTDGIWNRTVFGTFSVSHPSVSTPTVSSEGSNKYLSPICANNEYINGSNCVCKVGYELIGSDCVEIELIVQPKQISDYLKSLFLSLSNNEQPILIYSLLGLFIVILCLGVWYISKPKRQIYNGGKGDMKKWLKNLAEGLLIGGGLVHLVFGLLNVDVVQAFLGGFGFLPRVVYGLVGVSAVVLIVDKMTKA